MDNEISDLSVIGCAKCPTCGAMTDTETVQDFRNDRAVDQSAFRMVQTAMIGVKEKLDYVTEQHNRSEIERIRLEKENAQLLKSLSQAIQIARRYQDALEGRIALGDEE